MTRFQSLLALLLLSFACYAGASEKYQHLPSGLDGSMTVFDFEACDSLSGVPDSLEAVHISYIARHGARYLSSSKNVMALQKVLMEAMDQGRLSPDGERMMDLISAVSHVSRARWGELSPVGIEEEQRLGDMMVSLYPDLIRKGQVRAISTYVPRVVKTMYEYLHSMELRRHRLELSAGSGHRYDSLLRSFDFDPDYSEYRDSGAWVSVYDEFVKTNVPADPARRLLCLSHDNNTMRLRRLTMQIYSVLQGLQAMGLPAPTTEWMTPEEYRACWEASNLQRYLRNVPNPLNPYSAQANVPLLDRIISDADEALSKDTDEALSKDTDEALSKKDRIVMTCYFGHAETLLPILSILNIPGCSYPAESDMGRGLQSPIDMDELVNSLSSHWRIQDITPLGANLALIFMKPKGRTLDPDAPVYVAARLNGRLTEPYAGEGTLIPWPRLQALWQARRALLALP